MSVLQDKRLVYGTKIQVIKMVWNMLNREELNKFISETYGAAAEFPWHQYPDFAVYRHEGNKKWFAVVMNLPMSKFGLPDDKTVNVVNLKCDPLMTGSLQRESGIFPAYHMNKLHWISVLLDGTVDDEKLKWLLDISFELTE